MVIMLQVLFRSIIVGAITVAAAGWMHGGGGGGANYYFSSSTGSDSNAPCTSSSAPCQTISELNSISYPSGATINLKAGDTWSAGTTLTLSTSNVAGSLTVTTYGGGTCNVIAGMTSGCATLQVSGSQAIALSATQLSNLTIQNIRLIGGTSAALALCPTQPCPSGIWYANNGTNTSKITITNVEAAGFFYDIDFNYNVPNYPTGVTSNNVTITNNYTHGLSGTTSEDSVGLYATQMTNSLVQGNLSANIGGNAAGGYGQTGSGIQLTGQLLNVTAQFNVAHDSGANTAGGGALWANIGQNITFQFNEAFNALAGGSSDGDGYNFDCGVRDSIMQFNYSHNNWGPGYVMWAGGNGAYCNSNGSQQYAWGGTVCLDQQSVSLQYQRGRFLWLARRLARRV